jgi:hypothetical protein
VNWGNDSKRGHGVMCIMGSLLFQAGFLGFNGIEAISASYLKVQQGHAAE